MAKRKRICAHCRASNPTKKLVFDVSRHPCASPGVREGLATPQGETEALVMAGIMPPFIVLICSTCDEEGWQPVVVHRTSAGKSTILDWEKVEPIQR